MSSETVQLYFPLSNTVTSDVKMAQIETRPRYQRYFHEIRRKIDRSLAADSPDCDCVRPGNKSVVENRAINSGYKAVPPRWPALFTIPTISTFSRMAFIVLRRFSQRDFRVSQWNFEIKKCDEDARYFLRISSFFFFFFFGWILLK